MVILNPAYSFLEKDYENQNLQCFNQMHEKVENKKLIEFGTPKWIVGFMSTFIATVPLPAYASSESTFKNIYNTVMNIFDWGVVLVIGFAGATWMLGHRSKAIELLICAAIGYLIARHAIDIRDFLKTI